MTKRQSKEKTTPREKEIVQSYLMQLDKHLQELKEGKAESTFEIQDLAALLHIHPTHLSNTIKEALGESPCDIYEKRLIEIAKQLLLESRQSVASIARHLTFDPSNFSKFFRHFTGVTPKQFRDSHT